MLTSLSESVVDMLYSRPPSLSVLVVGLSRGKELHPKEKRQLIFGNVSRITPPPERPSRCHG